MAKATILVVDDDKNVSSLVEEVLKEDGYNVEIASSLFQAEGFLNKGLPSMMILDRQLPDGDGVDFCLKLRKHDKTSGIPILFLTAKKSLPDRILGLRVGGDDYLVKPFSPQELLARTNALLRRLQGAPAPSVVLLAGPLEVNLAAHKVYLKGREIEVWPKAYEVLIFLVRAPNRVLTRQFLLQRVWGQGADVEVTSNAVDVIIGHLRKRLGKFGGKISAVRGYGFRFDPEE